MSNTIRTILKYDWVADPIIKKVDDTQAKWQGRGSSPIKPKRLTPYIKDTGHDWKYGRTGYNHNHANTGPGARTGINNANRSKRKGVRQLAKLEIKKQLTDNQ